MALVTGELVDRLAQGVATGAAGQVGIVAPPALLGALLVTGNVLRSMSRPPAERVGQRIDAAVREELPSACWRCRPRTGWRTSASRTS